jgi:hypothetical protein
MSKTFILRGVFRLCVLTLLGATGTLVIAQQATPGPKAAVGNVLDAHVEQGIGWLVTMKATDGQTYAFSIYDLSKVNVPIESLKVGDQIRATFEWMNVYPGSGGNGHAEAITFIRHDAVAAGRISQEKSKAAATPKPIAQSSPPQAPPKQGIQKRPVARTVTGDLTSIIETRAAGTVARIRTADGTVYVFGIDDYMLAGAAKNSLGVGDRVSVAFEQLQAPSGGETAGTAQTVTLIRHAAPTQSTAAAVEPAPNCSVITPSEIETVLGGPAARSDPHICEFRRGSLELVFAAMPDPEAQQHFRAEREMLTNMFHWTVTEEPGITPQAFSLTYTNAEGFNWSFFVVKGNVFFSFLVVNKGYSAVPDAQQRLNAMRTIAKRALSRF